MNTYTIATFKSFTVFSPGILQTSCMTLLIVSHSKVLPTLLYSNVAGTSEEASSSESMVKTRGNIPTVFVVCFAGAKPLPI